MISQRTGFYPVESNGQSGTEIIEFTEGKSSVNPFNRLDVTEKSSLVYRETV